MIKKFLLSNLLLFFLLSNAYSAGSSDDSSSSKVKSDYDKAVVIIKAAKKYEEKTIYLYEVFFLVEYELYDAAGYLLANTTVESSRSTTSQKFISLNETELIIYDVINKSLLDFSFTLSLISDLIPCNKSFIIFKEILNSSIRFHIFLIIGSSKFF